MARGEIMRRRGQRGQTIILVAVCIVSLLAMAALAVDLVTLYVAKGEIQHAADAAALAGAKAFVESAVTTDPANTTLQGIAQTIACPDAACSSGYIAQALVQNPVSGSAAIINPASPVSYDFTNHPGNPRITVNLQKTNLPIFFARIWSSNLASVSATATAEAYNPTPQTSAPSAAPQCVKPLLVKNNGRGAFMPVSSPFINSDGTIHKMGTAASGGFIGQEFILAAVAGSCPATETCIVYKPTAVPNTQPHNFCSSCAASLTPPASYVSYAQSIACCDGSPYDFNQCGDVNVSATPIVIQGVGSPTPATQAAMQCVIHEAVGQDTLDTGSFLSSGDPMQIKAGSYSQGQLGVAANAPISTSDSIVTLPIYNDCAPPTVCVPPPPALPTVSIVGFLQVFVNDANPPVGDLDVTILNVVGCGGNSSSIGVSGGGISAIPVRLIMPGG